MRDCKEVLESLLEYLDKELSEKDCAEIKAHMELCRGCFDRAEFEKALRSHCKEKTHHECPESLKAKIQKLIQNF